MLDETAVALDATSAGRALLAASAVSPFGMAIVGPSWRVLHSNQAMADLVGVPGDDLVGQDLRRHLTFASASCPWGDDGKPDDVQRMLAHTVKGEVPTSLLLTRLAAAPAVDGGTWLDEEWDGEEQLVAVQTLPDLSGSLYDAGQALLEGARADGARAVQEATTALATAVTVADITQVMERQVESFGAAGMLIALADGPRLRLVSGRGYPPDVLSSLKEQSMGRSSPMVDAVQRRAPIFMESPREYRERYTEVGGPGRDPGKQAWAVLPMIAGGQTIGSWCLSFDEPHRFSVPERAMLTTLTALLAQAVARSEILEAERSLSRTLQRGLLPQTLPDVPGCAVVVRYQTAAGGLDVGGDFYDVIPLPGGGTGIVIGDAQGHSAAAAALMAQVRGALRAYAAEGHDPGTIVARANRFLVTAGMESFVTCTYAALDATSDGLTIVRAGHPQPLLVTPDGAAGSLDVPGGLPLGIDPQASYPVTWVPLTVGCRVVLYTDGLVEERGTDLGHGERALLARMRAAAGRPLESFVDSVLGPEQLREDDVALLVLERIAEAQGQGLRQETFQTTSTDKAAVRRIRHAVIECCRDWGWESRADEIELLVSELVTNAVVHVGGAVTVTVTAGVHKLTVAVTDTSVQSPAPSGDGPATTQDEDDDLKTSGRGLTIVELVADEWGVDPSGPGKSVWFSLHQGSGSNGS